MHRRIISTCLILLLTLCCTPVFACHIVHYRSVVFIHHTNFVCDRVILKPSSHDVDTWRQAEFEKVHMDDNYWQEWTSQSDSPFLTKNINNSYFGLGLWVPKALQDLQNDMGVEEWLKNQGVLFSLSFGDKHHPRLRFDYRWHDNYEADWVVQVEVPF